MPAKMPKIPNVSAPKDMADLYSRGLLSYHQLNCNHEVEEAGKVFGQWSLKEADFHYGESKHTLMFDDGSRLEVTVRKV